MFKTIWHARCNELVFREELSVPTELLSAEPTEAGGTRQLRSPSNRSLISSVSLGGGHLRLFDEQPPAVIQSASQNKTGQVCWFFPASAFRDICWMLFIQRCRVMRDFSSRKMDNERLFVLTVTVPWFIHRATLNIMAHALALSLSLSASLFREAPSLFNLYKTSDTKST